MPSPGYCPQALKIDKALLPPKLIYFLAYTMIVSLQAYSVVFYKDTRKYSITVTGMLCSMPSFVGFVSAPLFGLIADRFNAHKQILLISVTTSATFLICQYFFEQVGILSIFLFLGSFMQGPLMPLLDHCTLKLLGDQREHYGKQRMWGAVSYGGLGLALGIIANSLDTYVYFVAHGIFAIGTAVAIVVFLPSTPLSCSKPPTPTPPSSPDKNILVINTHDKDEVDLDVELVKEYELPFWTRLRLIFRNHEVVCLLITVFIIGTGMGILSNALFIFLSEIGGTETLLGLVIGVMCTAEIIVFIFSDKLLEKFSQRTIICAALIGYAIRFTYYSFLTNPWYTFPAEILHGLTFGAMWSACISYADELTPKGLGGTMQGLLNGCCFGLGVGSGTAYGAFVYDHYGSTLTFRCMAGWCIFGLLFFLGSNLLGDYLTKSKNKTDTLVVEDTKI